MDTAPRAAQRANILEGARQVFARKGTSATMADVAAAAGVSQGLAYRYFAGKDDIYRELLVRALEQAGAATAAAMSDDTATPGQRLTLLLTSLVEFRRDHVETFRLLDQLLIVDQAPAGLADLLRHRREGFLAELRRLIIAGQATGEVAADDPDQLVIALTTSLEGLTRFGIHHPEQFPRLCPDARILLRMLKP